MFSDTVVYFVVAIDTLTAFTAVYAVFLAPKLSAWFRRHNIKDGWYGTLQQYVSGMPAIRVENVNVSKEFQKIRDAITGITERKPFSLEDAMEDALDSYMKAHIKKIVLKGNHNSVEKRIRKMMNTRINELMSGRSDNKK